MNLSPENQLLLCCARTEMDEKVSQKARNILEHPLDWDCLIKTAYNHGVAPLLYKNLQRIGVKDVVSGETMKRLEVIYYATASRNFLQFQEIGKILKAFNDARIRAIILKGPALVERIYKNPALRPFSDVDLLIKEDDLQKTKECLETLKYTILENLISQKFYSKYHFNLPFVKKNGLPMSIEVHWDIVDRFKNYSHDISEIWDTACSIQISNTQALELCPESLLIYLCAHIDMHGYLNRVILNKELYSYIFHKLCENRLIWFVDIHEVIRCYDKKINWEEVIEISKKWGMAEVVYLGLSLTNRLFGSLNEGDVLRYLTPPKVNYFEKKIYGFIIDHLEEDDISPGFFSRFFTSIFLRTNKTLQFRPIRIFDIVKAFSLKPKSLRLYTRRFFSFLQGLF